MTDPNNAPANGNGAIRRRTPTGAGPAPKGVRLQRIMADAGVASRRDCEALIESGAVGVNGVVVRTLPVFVDPRKDRITVNGRPLQPRDTRDKRMYIMLNKPDRVLGTTRDTDAHEDGGRRTVSDLVKLPSGQRVYPVGRLDYATTGLVLLTDDGQLTERLTHARYAVTRTYRVVLGGKVPQETLQDLRRRLAATGQPPTEDGPDDGRPFVRVMRTPDRSPDTTVLEVRLAEGKNRRLVDLLEQMNCRVKKLSQTALGPLHLRQVAVGEWRELTDPEVRSLFVAAGLTSGSLQPTPASRRAAPRRAPKRRGQMPAKPKRENRPPPRSGPPRPKSR